MNKSTNLLKLINQSASLNATGLAVRGLCHDITYRDLLLANEKVSSFLEKNNLSHNVTCVIMPSDVEYIISIISIMQVRGVFCPISEIWPDERIGYFLNAINPSAVISNKHNLDRIHKLITNYSPHAMLVEIDYNGKDILIKRHGNSRLPDAKEINLGDPTQDSLYLIPTSGSTGIPKIVEGYHKALASFINWQSERFSVGPEIACAQLAPISFDVSLRDIFLPLANGGTLHIPSNGTKYHPILLSNWIESHRINCMHTVPSLLQFCMRTVLKSKEFRDKFRSLSRIFFCGEALSREIVLFASQHVNENALLVNFYGPTECTLVKCYYEIDKNRIPETPIIPIGHPINNATIEIAKDESERIGEIIIVSEDLAKGYYKNEELTKSKFKYGPDKRRRYYTGDLGYFDQCGTLHFSGRIDDQVKIRGNRVELSEIDGVIKGIPGVINAATIFISKKENEDRLYSFYESDISLNPEIIINAIKQKLPAYMIPTDVYRLDSLPINDNGKLNKSALINTIQERPE